MSHGAVTHLCIVRHGESVWNVERRVQGQLDPALTELGLRQARAVAERLRSERWDALYSSDLARARTTAECIGQAVGLPVRVRRDLRERSQGRLEGLLASEARSRYPDWDAPEVGRETVEALRERAKEAFGSIVAAHPGERVLVVAHGALIYVYLEHLSSLGAGDGGVQMENTAITRIEWADRPRLVCVNDTAHLKGGGLRRTDSLRMA